MVCNLVDLAINFWERNKDQVLEATVKFCFCETRTLK